MNQNIKITNKKTALIYCRVSTVNQERDGSGLESQEHRCRQYAETNGYEVEKVFRDSFSGGGDFMRRPGMSSLLDFLDKNLHKNYIVIFDDMKRLARDTMFFLKLKMEFRSRGARMESPNFVFVDTYEGDFSQIIVAAQAELERNQNKRQVVQKMKARLESGFWPFYHPPGYRSESRAGMGKVLIVKRGESEIIKDALEGFASNRFSSVVDVYRFLIRRRFIKNDGKNHIQRALDLLYRAHFYAGFIEYKKWEVSRRIGRHQAIISTSCLEKIEEKLGLRQRNVTRIDDSNDFPLRRFVACSVCGGTMTGSWSTGRNGRHPYYRCNKNGCLLKNKSIKKNDIETSLEKILGSIKPKQVLLEYTKAKLFEKYYNIQKEVEVIKKEIQFEINKTQGKIKNLVDKITTASNPSVIKIYEDAIAELTITQKADEGRLLRVGETKKEFGTAVSLVLGILENPLLEWKNGDFEHKRLILNMVFLENPRYDKKEGFGTAKYSLPIKVFEGISTANSSGVEMTGVEPVSKILPIYDLQA